MALRARREEQRPVQGPGSQRSLLLAGGCGERRPPSGVREETTQSGSVIQRFRFCLALSWLASVWTSPGGSGKIEVELGRGGNPRAVPEEGTTRSLLHPPLPQIDREWGAECGDG